MNQCLAQLQNAEMCSKILFLSKKVLNKFNDYVITLKCSMAHHKALSNLTTVGALEKGGHLENFLSHPISGSIFFLNNYGSKLLGNI